MEEKNFDLLTPLLGALQASVSVLLTICYGVIARRLKLVNEEPVNEMSGISVKIFLPALLIVNLGSNLHLENALNYIPVLGMVQLRGQKYKMLTCHSMVSDLHFMLHWSRVLFNKSIQSSPLGYPGMRIQQYDISALVIAPIA